MVLPLLFLGIPFFCKKGGAGVGSSADDFNFMLYGAADRHFILYLALFDIFQTVWNKGYT